MKRRNNRKKIPFEDYPSKKTPVSSRNLNKLQDNIEEVLYPIGTVIYNILSDFDPNVTLGGTWERIKGKMLIGVDEEDNDFNVAGKTGGEKSHKLTVQELPKFKIKIYASMATAFGGNSLTFGNNNGTAYDSIADPIGGDLPHNNMPPYETVYIWKRVA